MSLLKILEKFDRVLTGRKSVFDVVSHFFKNWGYLRFFNYIGESTTSYTIIKNISY